MEFDRVALLQTFAAESDEDLAGAEAALVALEARPGDVALVQTVLRAAHSLKGNAASLGFTRLTALAHAVEDLLVQLEQRGAAPDAAAITLLLESVDALRASTRAAVAGREPPGVCDALAQRLVALTAGAHDPPGAPVADEHDAPVPARADREAGSTADASAPRSVRIGIEKLDALLDLMGEISIAHSRALTASEGAGAAVAREAHRDVARLLQDMQQRVLGLRLLPLAPALRPYARAVRDLAAACGKQAHVRIETEGVELDARVIEQLRDPLMHMVRNAVDHGIEPPAARLAAGKPAAGTVELRARRDAAGVAITVRDDGAGLDRERILARARTVGLVGPGESPADAEVHGLIFAPGFSTAERVTELSGRGMGMDIVRRRVAALRGTVRAEGSPGAGTTVTIALPLTVAIIDGFHVGVGEQTYVIPLDCVVECVDLPPAGRGDPNLPCGVLDLRGQPVPYARLRMLFDDRGDPPARESVVVVRHADRCVGLTVDVLHGESQSVIKPLDGLCRRARGIAGATVLGTGRVALVLDVPAVLRAIHEREAGETAAVTTTRGTLTP